MKTAIRKAPRAKNFTKKRFIKELSILPDETIWYLAMNSQTSLIFDALRKILIERCIGRDCTYTTKQKALEEWK